MDKEYFAGGLPDLVENGVEFSPEVIALAIVNIYRKDFDIDRELEAGLFEETRRIFREAVEKGIVEATDGGVPLPEDAFVEQLKHNTDVFSAFRTHRMQKDIAALMVDGDGKVKPFPRFQKDAMPYVSHRNRAWLRTEYDTAIQRAHIAAQWKQFEAEQDVLPNLEWIPSTSPHPGEDHRIFWGTIRPIDDPFWSKHRPGDRWNCKCELRATDEPANNPATDVPPTDKPAAGLETNPGKGGVVFSKKHPYYAAGCTTCPFVKNKLRALFADLTGRRDCTGCRGVENAMKRAELLRLNKHDHRAEFQSAQYKIQKALLKEAPVSFDGRRYYSGRLYCGKKDVKSVMAHCFDGMELEAAKQLYNLLSKLKNGRYEPINMERKNYKRKMREGVRNFVRYEVKTDNGMLELKCKAVKYKGLITEHPYSLKRKRE